MFQHNLTAVCKPNSSPAHWHVLFNTNQVHHTALGSLEVRIRSYEVNLSSTGADLIWISSNKEKQGVEVSRLEVGWWWSEGRCVLTVG